MIQVTITCDTLDELANYLKLGAAPAPAKKNVQKEVAADAVLQSASTGGTTVAEPAKEEVKEEPKVTVQEIRALVGSLSKSGKRENCKELLNEFGAESVTTLNPEQYNDFFNRLKQL